MDVTLHEAILVLVRQLLKTLALGFREQQSREDTSEHEEGENLQNVREEFICATNVFLIGQIRPGQ